MFYYLMFYKDTIRKSKGFRFLFCCLTKLLNRFGMLLKSVLRQLPRGKLPPGQLPPRKITPWTVVPPREFLPRKIALAPRTTVPEENWPPENCPLTMKFPSKIIASFRANTPKEYYKLTEENYALCTSTIIYEYCNLGEKSDLLPNIFYRF